MKKQIELQFEDMTGDFQSKINKFIEDNYDLNQPVLYGLNLLQISIRKGDYAGAELLLKNGANPNYVPRKGYTTLSIAVQEESLDLIRLLIEYGADVNQPDYAGLTPLMYAAVLSNEAAFQELLKNGSEINHKTVDGRDIIYYVLSSQILDVMENYKHLFNNEVMTSYKQNRLRFLFLDEMH